MISDVVVVGAGPAGSYLGYLLARRGVSVTILDKASFPRDKVCGGGISPKTIALLDFDIGPAVDRRITGALLTFRNRDTIAADLPERLSGATVLRSAFDELILQRAREAGARFEAGAAFLSASTSTGRVTACTTSGDFHARYLVGADGVFSTVRTACFGRGLVRYAPAVEALVYLDADARERIGRRVLFDLGGMPGGYGWIFPKADHLNVGVFSVDPRRSIKADLDRFMSRFRVLDRPRQTLRLGFSIPLRNTRNEYQRGRVLLVGDAAGCAESVYGEGIYFALKSAVLAARGLLEALAGGSETGYQALVQNELAPELAYSRLNARLFFSWQSMAYHAMARSPRVNAYFSGLITGEVGHRACFYKTILTSPSWLLAPKLRPLEATTL
jgi:geranylgeranyl reductase family protein